MKNLKLIVTAVVIIGLILTANFLFRSEFKSGWCVKHINDSYIWQINDFSFGKYRVMGWQDGAWGNAVSIEKGVIERKDVSGIKIYNQTTCPEYRKVNLQENIIGHWRNDTEKRDYLYFKNNLLTTVGEKGSAECTYEISKQNDEEKSLEMWFKCPQPDWPGYAELHKFDFSKNTASFVDTMYIQGIAFRVDGEFYKVGEK